MLSARRRRRPAGVIGAGVIGVGVLVLVGTFSGCAATSGGGGSEAARRELLARLERGATTTWAMTTQFHRETPAGPLDAKLEQLNRQPDWLTVGFGSVRGVWNGQTIDCASAPSGKLCGPAAAVDPAVDARTSVADLRTATGPKGTARVRRDGTIRAAGRRAHCYSVVPRRDRADRRAVTQYCLTRDGIPLRVRVRRTDTSDTATAQEIRTTVADADFERLLTGYPISPPS
ncbi:MAG: hypothetical protein ACXW2C_02270 [Acidimicrobiia bacterium]